MLIPVDQDHFSRGPLSYSTAIRAAYEADLDWIESMLRAGLSVLVTAEKSLALQLYAELRNRLRRGEPSIPSVLIKAPPSSQNRSFLHGMVENLWEQVHEQLADPAGVVVLPHLDLLATTTESSLGTPAREAIAAMSQDPSLRFLAFCDPGLKIPQALSDLFDVQREIIGIRRDTLPYLITYEEAQRLAVDKLNVLRLYKYVSGIHAIKFRKLMVRLMEFPPLVGLPPEEREPQRERIERMLREMTLLGGMEIPNIDLERDVGGYKEVKKQLREEILDILALREDPDWADQIKELEETLPHGILFYGPPGTGKTYLAKALATALQATTIVVSGPEVKSKWVGESEANLRRLFAQARSAAPSLIIFDEIDAIAPRRGLYAGSGVEHSLVNQLLTEMDGFRKEELVFVVGTTNLMDSVDPALLRPGRFEYHIHIPYPDRTARRDIIEVYAKKFQFAFDDKSMEYLIERTGTYVDATRGIRYSGDHIYGIARQLKRLQARKRGKASPYPITQAEIDEVMGPSPYNIAEKRERSRKKAAYHEAGHALAVAYLLEPQAIQKATISAEHPDVEGMVSMHSYVSEGATEAILQCLIQVALAGRAAEMLIFNELDIGAKNDLDFATDMARMMVEDLGMSQHFGPRVYRLGDGRETTVSGITRERIDKEINQILKDQYTAVAALMEAKKDGLERLTQALLDKQELDSKEIAELLELPHPQLAQEQVDSTSEAATP
ncbi:MAG: AAA family ATPase [Deltaproteobacteria bacterium]|nr:MAG: AAA family ATPase [Deltaproteobacteria bacterium]